MILTGIYSIFSSLFGGTLDAYMQGTASGLQPDDMSAPILLASLAITAVTVVLFYFVINYPNFNNFAGWFVFLAINGLLNFLLGWRWVAFDFNDGKMVSVDPATGLHTPLPIFEDDLIMFGVSNAIVSVVAFTVLSYCLKWWSTNCSRAPF
ncbi:MAG: hypothetical protein J1E84_02245 [Muribaculaceae bacterium]|nr:hypothetical protein [Muribaculaceae bacterium]